MFEEIFVEILYEDRHIAVCVKDAGLLSQADESGDESMIDILSTHFKEQGDDGYVGVVHRLDRGVGGVMVYAKTKEAAGKLSGYVSDKERFRKEYLALVHGVPAEQKGVMKDLLFKDSSINKSFVVDRMRRGVKEASLEYELVSTNDDVSLVHIVLHTGRTHQIRVQFSSRGMPLVGDKKYGARDSHRAISLWSYSLSFEHPVTHKSISFKAEPPEGFGI